MKTAFEKVIVGICLVVLSLASCIIGMYLLFNTKMEFKFHIAFTFIFMGALVFSILAVLLMFKKPTKKPKAEDAPKEETAKAKEKPSLFGKKEEEPALPKDEPLPFDEEDLDLSEKPQGMHFDPDTGKPLDDIGEAIAEEARA